jgi:methyl-accepting chemotaxis protein
MITGVSVALALLTILVIFFIVQSFVVKPLGAVVRVVEKASKKDFSEVLTVRYKDEIGSLSESINSMSGAIAETMKQIATISKDLSGNAGTLKEAIEQSVEGTRQQAQQASLIATASEEMSQTVTGIAQNGAKAADLSSAAMGVAKSGKNVVQESVGKIESAGQSTRELSAMIDKLNTSVTEIGNIITVIKDIADQTNLLALNAAIEAARAGEQGRGFAVVADEVRKLAERTMKATGEISGKISAVQEGSRQTKDSMENAVGYVTESVVFMQKAHGALDEIVQSINAASDEVSLIAASVEEQSATAHDITRNIEDISVSAQQAENAVKNLLGIFETLNNFSRSLNGMAEEFTFLGKNN